MNICCEDFFAEGFQGLLLIYECLRTLKTKEFRSSNEHIYYDKDFFAGAFQCMLLISECLRTLKTKEFRSSNEH